MALRDYESENEDEFYGQDFDYEGAVSVWVGLKDDADTPEGLDVLQDWCGVGYYDHDQQELNTFDFRLSDIAELLKGISFSDSFAESVVEACLKKGITQARWIILQYDFAYDPEQIIREIADEPIFVGFFEYEED